MRLVCAPLLHDTRFAQVFNYRFPIVRFARRSTPSPRKALCVLFETLPLCLVAVSLASLTFAQGGATGAISGVVQDSSGTVIANAKVSVTGETTGEAIRQPRTDATGLFNATLLPVGKCTAGVNATGFPDTKITGVVVRITETTRITATH